MNKLIKKNAIEKVKDELSEINEKGKKTRTGRFVVAALGSIPWIDGAIAAIHAEKEQLGMKLNQ